MPSLTKSMPYRGGQAGKQAGGQTGRQAGRVCVRERERERETMHVVAGSCRRVEQGPWRGGWRGGCIPAAQGPRNHAPQHAPRHGQFAAAASPSRHPRVPNQARSPGTMRPWQQPSPNMQAPQRAAKPAPQGLSIRPSPLIPPPPACLGFAVAGVHEFEEEVVAIKVVVGAVAGQNLGARGWGGRQREEGRGRLGAGEGLHGRRVRAVGWPAGRAGHRQSARAAPSHPPRSSLQAHLGKGGGLPQGLVQPSIPPAAEGSEVGGRGGQREGAEGGSKSMCHPRRQCGCPTETASLAYLFSETAWLLCFRGAPAPQPHTNWRLMVNCVPAG